MKKAITFLLCLLLVVTSLSIFTACEKDVDQPEKLTMLFLGDSIAEGILGPSPTSERESYAYYSILGKINDYTFINRSVSGHETIKMLEYVKREDDGARMIKTHIKTADIIHISILGNDFLRMDMSPLLLKVAYGDFSELEQIQASSFVDFSELIGVLRKDNPTATILMQTCYDPIYKMTPLVTDACRAELATLGFDTEDDYRKLGNKMIAYLNGIIVRYLRENPGAYEIVDVWKDFDDIFNLNAERGKALIFNDGVHPSNEGHAVITECIQKKLVELGLADNAKALEGYKKLRAETLNRLYSTCVDVNPVIEQMNKAKSMSGVTVAYFKAVENKIPIYD